MGIDKATVKTVIHIQLPDMKTITKKQEQVETMKGICCYFWPSDGIQAENQF
jgi:hypothetical protein